MTGDPYQILGVPEDASKEEIGRAFRRLAKRYHPDLNVGDTAAEQKFKEVTAAFRTLRDHARRETTRPAADGQADVAATTADYTAERAAGRANRTVDRRPQGLQRLVLAAAITTIGILLLLYYIWANTETDWIPGCCY